MKNIRKVFALMLALVMCLGMFAGCSEQGGEEIVGPAPTIATVPIHSSIAGKSNAERYPLNCDKTYTIANRMDEPNERELFQGWNEVTGVNANWVDLKGDPLSQAMGGGDMPDAICISWGVDKSAVYEFGKAGKLVNFAEYLQYMPNFQKMLQKYPNALTNFLNVDGSFYSLPSHASGIGSPANLLYVRKDFLDNSGLQMPKTVDEFKKFVLDMQKHGENVEDIDGFVSLNFLKGGSTGYLEWNGYMDNFFFPSFGNDALQTGYDLVGDKIVLGCTTEQYKRYLKYMAELYNSGACEQDIYSADCEAANLAKTANNQVAIAPNTSVNENNFISETVELVLVEPLTSQWQSKKIWSNQTVPGWMLNCINGELPEEDIITLVQWFDAFYATDEDPLNEAGTVNGMYLYTGEKNVHWRDLDATNYERIYTGEYKTTTEYVNNEGCNATLYSVWSQKIQYENTKFYCKQIGVRDTLWPHIVERWTPESLFLTEEEGYEATDIRTELKLYMDSAFAKFITGKWTVENNWDEYISNLESIGAMQLIEIYQTAYNRHK